jgi:hypothetical protein
MKLLNIISGPIKDGNINGNLVTVILVLINYRSKKYLTNFEANAKQNEVKINNRFSEELPADADETNVTRQVKKRVFLMLRLKFHQIPK